MGNLNRRHFVSGLAFTATAGILLNELSGCGENKSRPKSSGKPLSLQAPWVNDAEFIGYFVAIANGYYSANALDFRYQAGGPDKIAGEILGAGGCDIALTNIDGTAEAITRQGAKFKIIGAQYQKSPLGIVTLDNSGIRTPGDLTGRRIAVPAANRATLETFLKLNGVNPEKVRLLPYQYDPTILVDGHVDATVDFVTNVPYTIRLRGKKPFSFLFYDYGFRQFMDTVVVHEDTIKLKRKELIGFLRASRRGWDENFKDVNKYPETLKSMMSDQTGRTVDSEKYFNTEQQPLISSAHGVFALTEEAIEDNIRSLRAVGLHATRSMFVPDLLSEV